MRKRFALFLMLLLCVSQFGCAAQNTGREVLPAPEAKEETFTPHTPENFKGVWISQWDLKDVLVTDGAQRDEREFRALIDTVMANIARDGFNTVFVQVRPFGDSFYPSEYYPPSAMAAGEYGNEFLYDPFQIIVEEAHAQNLSIQAWINPLRLMKTEELEQISGAYLIRRWYDEDNTRGNYLVLQSDGRWYLNPGYQAVRELIVSGAREILERYEVDGLHMDDYFYPTTDESYDRACFAEAKSANAQISLSDFRRESLTLLVRALYETVHETRPGATFGIAPGGNLDDAYLCRYADIYTWCGEDPCVDYLCPEIYFGLEHEFCPFEATAQKWSQIIQNEKVKYYIGLSFHKSGLAYDPYAGSGAYEWATHSDILARSLECALNIENCSGVCVFCYKHFFDPVTGAEPDYPKEEREAFLALWKAAEF